MLIWGLLEDEEADRKVVGFGAAKQCIGLHPVHRNCAIARCLTYVEYGSLVLRDTGHTRSLQPKGAISCWLHPQDSSAGTRP